MYVCVYSRFVCEIELRSKIRSAVAVTQVAVRGWEFLTVDDSTASCGVFQHLNNFPFIRTHSFPLSLFRFSTLKAERGGN